MEGSVTYVWVTQQKTPVDVRRRGSLFFRVVINRTDSHLGRPYLKTKSFRVWTKSPAVIR